MTEWSSKLRLECLLPAPRMLLLAPAAVAGGTPPAPEGNRKRGRGALAPDFPPAARVLLLLLLRPPPRFEVEAPPPTGVTVPPLRRSPFRFAADWAAMVRPAVVAAAAAAAAATDGFFLLICMRIAVASCAEEGHSDKTVNRHMAHKEDLMKATVQAAVQATVQAAVQCIDRGG